MVRRSSSRFLRRRFQLSSQPVGLLVNCCDQVLSLTSFIEFTFDLKKKTSAVFLELSEAYYTVWKERLLVKLYNLFHALMRNFFIPPIVKELLKFSWVAIFQRVYCRHPTNKVKKIFPWWWICSRNTTQEPLPYIKITPCDDLKKTFKDHLRTWKLKQIKQNIN